MDAHGHDSLTFERVEDAQDPRFSSLLAIYRSSHPASERKPGILLSEMVKKPEYLFIAAILEAQVVGFAISNWFPQSDACLLEYMAITQERRGQGIGKMLFKYLIAMPQIAGRYLLAELDSERPSPGNHPEEIRRKRFYLRLGCREIAGLRYIMPPVASSTPPAMDIMVYRRNLPTAISRTTLRGWLQSIYVNVYQMREDDPRIAEMLENIPEEARLL
jgi:GNAT superfamily N-acetyltransferase